MTHERTINRTVNNTFEEIDRDAFSKLIILFEIFKKKKKKIEPAMQNMIFDFFQSALICPILTHFEKKNLKVR